MVKKVSERGGQPPLVICDFDGTISLSDVGHQVLKHFSGSRWTEIDRAYCRGQIGSREAYSLIASFIRVTEEEIRSFLDSHAGLDPAFRDFYEFCIASGMGFKIISDGLDFYIREIMSRNGLGHIEFFANRLVFRQDGTISIEFPYGKEECGSCGTCKSNILAGLRHQHSRIIYIGDGHSDVCPARSADLVFGKKTLYRKCLENGTNCILYDSFKTIHDVLKGGKDEYQPRNG